MPKEPKYIPRYMRNFKFKCGLCGRPLRNLEQSRRIHDGTCPGFKRLHEESVRRINERAAQARATEQTSTAPTTTLDVLIDKQSADSTKEPPKTPSVNKTHAEDAQSSIPT
uniref:C2H2-type domain-containing protein n=1 Tax=Mycena chlorophos TaxID=658473 RepID=A0ABQ0M8H8_MYCCL|nr:predicted protein [Mycena chlorophos]